MSDSRPLTLENKHSFPVHVDWTLLKVLNKTTGKFVKNPFNVVPASFEIPAQSSAVFNVDFAPYEPDSYFFQVAQAFVTLLNGRQHKTKKLSGGQAAQGMEGTLGANSTLKRQSNNNNNATANTKTLLGTMKKSKYQDFSQEDVDPPICLNVRLCGHSFAPGSHPFIPMIKLD